MGKSSAAIVMALGLTVSGISWALTDADPSSDPRAGCLQTALSDLRSGRLAAAAESSRRLATHGAVPQPRAWLVVAAARYRQGRRHAAVEAYQHYLSSCDSPSLRRYARGRVSACRADPPPDRAPSERLGAELRDKLTVVDDVVHAESTDHFVIRTRNYQLSQVVAREAEAALRRIRFDLLDGRAFAHNVDVYVWPDRQEYLDNAPALAPEWSDGSFSITNEDGLTTWRIDLTQLDEDGNFSTRMLDRVLPHELAHIVLKDFFGDAPCPLAVNEGVAMLAEARCDNGRLELAGTAIAGRSGIPLSKLLVLPDEEIDGRQDLFYAEALSFAEFLRGRMTRHEFRRFLDHVKSGSTVAAAVQQAMYIPADEPLMPDLTAAWEDYAVAQSQMLRALSR